MTIFLYRGICPTARRNKLLAALSLSLFFDVRRSSLFRPEIYDIIHSVGDCLMASSGLRSGAVARRRGTERNSISGTVCRVVTAPRGITA